MDMRNKRIRRERRAETKAKREKRKVAIKSAFGKTCLDCTKCMIDYEGDLSDVTPGQGLTVECSAGHWSQSGNWKPSFGREQLKYDLATAAENCPDFSADENIENVLDGIT